MIDGGLRPLFRTHVSFDWVAVESGTTSVGAPDSNFCAKGGIEGWVEFKATKNDRVKFRPLQPAWIVRRRAWGGRVKIAVRQTTASDDVLWLFDGRAVTQLVETGLRGAEDAALAVLTGGPRRWGWEEVRRLLLV